jgi:hypothetical protein
MRGTWYNNLEHSGVEIRHDSKPEQEIINKLKSAGFRWSRRQQIWYAKGWPYQVNLLNEIADYGGEVGEKKSFAKKMEEKVERAEARAERFEDLAERTEQKGRELHEEAHQMASVIPFGQPILVGHHSERSDRNYRDRIHNKFGKAFETLEKAEYFENRAEAAAKFEEKTFDTGRTLRRIERLHKIVRSIELDIDNYIVRWAYDLARFKKGLQDKRYTELSRKTLEGEYERKNPYQEQIDYWKAQIEARGGKVWGRDDFQKGDIIMTRFGPARVLKTNPKTVKVLFLNVSENDWSQRADFSKVPYNELKANCKNVEVA